MLHGEELTFDYACVTESEREFKAATCLCATRGCRGSFLGFSGSRAFMQVWAESQRLVVACVGLSCRVKHASERPLS